MTVEVPIRERVFQDFEFTARIPRNKSIPPFYNIDTREALRLQIQWLQNEFGLSDSFFSALIDTREELFREWRQEHDTLKMRQLECLKQFWLVFTHILSFLNYQPDLVQKMLEKRFDHSTSTHDDRVARPAEKMVGGKLHRKAGGGGGGPGLPSSGS